MSIPGLGQIIPQAAAASSTRTITLQPLWEWRFQVPRSNSAGVTVRLLNGTAERDGTSLALNRTYTFIRTKSKLLTWYGCVLEVEGECTEHVAKHNPHTSAEVAFVNLHFALQERRAAVQKAAPVTGAAGKSPQGPRVMICGPDGTGKTTLARTLTALAQRMGSQPLLANVSPEEGLLSLPGTMSAAVYGNIMDVEEPSGGLGVRNTPTSGPSAVPVKLPMVYYFGREKVEDDVPLWRALVSRLASSVRAKINAVDKVRSSDLIIDTPAFDPTKSGDMDLLAHVVNEFAVNIVVILSSTAMETELERRLAQTKTPLGEVITILALDKSDGVAERDKAWKRSDREEAIREYFFGDLKKTLSPFTHLVSYDELAIFRLPEGTGPLVSAEVSAEMSNWTIAVMDASVNDPPKTIQLAPVMGFIAVAEVDEDRRRLKFLSPVSGRLGNRPLVWARWPEPYINLLG
ncbi:Pre-mRNA cleavage complex II protein Clp1-domain-containing protein [Bombardia bombarda]|uniref:Polynucleotide 5'-hydroxyl-kinase GRC3 n=1 Tax=Bombardia bombarda TaxID=252184 RepID=A0AA39XN27_9PEZI|nr:Pre-mRNA cleavage complex II protein Clp1-domain-containing protein [Bombardia bombarda]